ncbi:MULTISPECIES: glycosyltransferase family 2 protein [unclassified Ruegeria]|uniref:glycosyltransferase family 2 protein n=1 Tax=unclassified Ruegeria TaxID=2625375 RepID=UPI001489E41D|nr:MULTISPECIES: glycosyltransferase family 2 protein [unclassified Ruegeria]NOD88244.1 glycosyltransferase [Ruegeria sp. HKCCD4318]NOE13153.1 glycosyltransferase [Ruegeria sp. HKCCD4318-2]NOG11305.1 glycosyltransferase [Ruegeria sp. HKCCD4315]
MPTASIVVPAYNAAATLAETLASLQAQTYDDFEIIIVDDGSQDATSEIARAHQGDTRVRLVGQANRGLAGARNTGIAAARGKLVGFCDADDLWMPEKLAAHVHHLKAEPDVGVSYSGSALIDEAGCMMGIKQAPRLKNVTAAHVLNRNPIGNGSAAVIRKTVLEALAYRPSFETERDWVFDETFRQSEDIECWMRLMLKTDWQIEGVPGLLTHYRINAGGLSAALDRQLEAWERMVAKLRPLNPEFFAQHEPASRAYQLRYLARRAITNLDRDKAWELFACSVQESLRPVFEEPMKTFSTFAAALVLKTFGPGPITRLGQMKSKLQSI